MNKKKFTKLKPLKDIDSVAVSLFLKSLSWALPFLGLLGLIYGYKLAGILGALLGLFLSIISSIGAALITMFISNKIGEMAGFLYKGPKANWSFREQFEADLNQVRYHKMNKRFDQALLKVEEVLRKEPNFPDALLLKAGILWEGFDEPIEAKRCLKTILQITQKGDSYYTWASTLHEDIVKEEKKRLDDREEITP